MVKSPAQRAATSPGSTAPGGEGVGRSAQETALHLGGPVAATPEEGGLAGVGQGLRHLQPTVLYHHTSPEARASILEHGLCTRFSEAWSEDAGGTGGVFLTTNPIANSSAMDVWSVDVAALKLDGDEALVAGEEWFSTCQDLPPARLKLVSRGGEPPRFEFPEDEPQRVQIGPTTLKFQAFEEWLPGAKTCSPVVELTELHVLPGARGAGEGRRALQAFLVATDAAGHRVRLVASPLDRDTDLGRLVAFYQSEGFQPMGTSNGKGEPWLERQPGPRTSAPPSKLGSGLWPPTPEHQALARKIALEGYQERARERGFGSADDLSGACKFCSLFAQRLFGGELRGNKDHQFVLLPGGERLDLTEGSKDHAEFQHRGVDPFRHDPAFWGNREHKASLKSCLPRVQGWVERFHVAQPEFRAWFGASKVVDGEGRPLLLHRGDAKGALGVLVPGQYLFATSSRAYAENFGTQVSDLFLNLANPLDLRALGDRKVTMAQVVEALRGAGVVWPGLEESAELYGQTKTTVWNVFRNARGKVVPLLAAAGYDGLLWTERLSSDMHTRRGVRSAEVFVALHPTRQVWLVGGEPDGFFRQPLPGSLLRVAKGEVIETLYPEGEEARGGGKPRRSGRG